MPTIFTPFHHQTSKSLRRLFIIVGVIFWLGATAAALTPALPHLLYRLSPQTSQALASTLSQPVSTSQPTAGQPNLLPSRPPLDSSLPQTNILVISKIGVNGPIHEGDNWQDILQNGIWRTPNFGTPKDSLPVILASHRWGYLSWTNEFRRHNSFYSLPKLKPGDSLEIIWQQRKYTYQVTSTSTGEQVNTLDTDLILYTCQLWNSPIRIFVYAKRTN